MQNEAFIINGRFWVDVERSELLDKTTSEKNRLEPRLMKLLLLLTAQQGKVVKREYIIKEIWDDYPGANEGLNQAISFLRKLLADEGKAIIQTQPKAGYSFHAVISTGNTPPAKSKNKYVPIILGILVLALLLFFAVDIYVRKKASPATDMELRGKQDAAATRGDSIHQAQERKRFMRDTLGPAARGDSIRR